MCRDASKRKSGQLLFRQAAVKAVGHRLFGGVSIAVPPSARTALAISVLAVAALIAVTCLVEIPQRSRAIGVLMPAGGLFDVVASRSGQVGDVLVSVGQHVEKGQLLFTIGDSGHLRGESAADFNLRSLHNEMTLLTEAHARQREITADRLIRLQEEADTAARQLEIAQERYAAHINEVEILEARFFRWQKLFRNGHAPRDAFDLEHANLVRARAEGAVFRHLIAAATQTAQTISRSQTEAQKQLGLNTVQNALNAERLQREIELGQHDVMQKVRVGEQSVIAQMLVQQGDAVRAGQVLARMHRPGERLQAWLYLPSSNARQLRNGQSVEISLDAYPHQVYGTQTAVVSSVSAIALLPEDIRAPLLLTGPVFEVRADLKNDSIMADGRNWPLPPGTSFSADIIQNRLKLYEWLFRSLVGEPLDGNG